MKIDLKSFKKLSSDKDSTTFQHRDGHKLTVSHKGLSPNTLKDIQNLPSVKLADGGDPAKQFEQGYKQSTGTQAVTKQQPESADPLPENYQDKNTNDNQQLSQDQPSQASGYADGGRVAMYAEGTPNAPAAPTDATQTSPTSDPAGANPVSNYNAAPMLIQQPNYGPQAPLFQPAVNPDPNAPGPTAQWLNDEEAKQANDYLQGNIHPNTYAQWFGKKDTVGKVGTMLGIMLGGAGGGITGQGNVVLDMIHNEIQNDLEAQKKRADNTLTFYKAVQQNPQIQATAQNLKANTAAINQTMGFTNTLQASFASALDNIKKIQDPQKRAQMAQGLMAAYSQSQMKVYDMNKVADLMSMGFQGNPGSQGQQQQPGQPQSVQQQLNTPLLNDKAKAEVPSLSFNPVNEKNYKDVQDQYTQASYMQQGREQIGQLMDKMRKEATLSSYLSGKIDPKTWAELGGGAGGILGALGTLGIGAVPAAGAGAGVGAGAAVATKQALKALANQRGIDYETDRSTLQKLLGTYLAKSNLNTEQIGDFAKNATPMSAHIEGQDAFENKKKQIDDMLINQVPKDHLRNKGWSNF